MEEEGQSKFVCKLCSKKFSCGKSLGGHMRSHVISANSDEFEFDVKKISSFGEDCMIRESKYAEFVNGQSSYGLRENPRKTWRAVDSRFLVPQERFCKQCGKGFHSLKALCGHMACHSEKDKGLKDDHSWTSENHKLVLDSHSDTETEETRQVRTRSSSKGKRYIEKSNSFSLANNGSSSVSEIDGQEQEEVAMCLMLLSRDSRSKGGCGANSVVESSDNNSVVLETKSSSNEMKVSEMISLNHIHSRDDVPDKKKIGKLSDDHDLDAEIAEMENSDSGYFLDECAKAESDISVDRSHRYGALGNWKTSVETRRDVKAIKRPSKAEISDFIKQNKYDDDNDGEGGMASNFAGIESRKRKYSSYNQNPKSWNAADRIMNKFGSSSNAEVCNNSPKRSKYECLNCKKTFKSFQALGGHRPCHKRNNTFYDPKYESDENSLEDSTEHKTRKPNAKNSSSHYNDKKKIKPKKGKAHVCPFCSRVFKNGQALGGHKRSHFIGGHEEYNNRNNVVKNEHSDLLDLNLPAPEADEDDGNGQFFSW